MGSVEDEILQDFLLEAGEILEQLPEQLVALEKKPEDKDLLNTIFRAIHTLKGGAGFLQLEAMIECCHATENLFDVLRKGKQRITSKTMDTVLKALDTINNQYQQVSQGKPLKKASAELLSDLESIAGTESVLPKENKRLDSTLGSIPNLNHTVVEIPDSKDVDQNSVSEDISEEEFEELLDQLHGVGKAPGYNVSSGLTSSSSVPAIASTSSKEDLITEQEFDDLLDQLYGKDKAVNEGVSRAIATDNGEISPPSSPKAVAETEATVRVDTRQLDEIMNMVGELVLVRNRLVRLSVDNTDEALGEAVANLDVVTADLQMSVMKTRMQPIKKVFGRFPRVVRDLARSLNKEINLEMQGEETGLDKNLVEALADPLVHLVRNAVDHGIEQPSAREELGKPRTGKIIFTAAQEGDHILLTITDDGAGIDPELLRKKVVEKGLLNQDAAIRLSDTEALDLIFMPGFSTRNEISELSGRGVGMDVVKTKINQLNGSINITSTMGEGSCLKIQVPLTLAIMPTLMVLLEGQAFALPLVSVNEIFQMDLTQTNIVDGQECVIIRDKPIPLFYLKRWLIKQSKLSQPQKEAHVVIVSVGVKRVGFVVDQLIGQEEVVIKPLGKMLGGTPGMAGATITGDGTMALILDVPSMLEHYAVGA